ncbi:MAG: hypothetical protein O2943_04910 [Actinomycetota bacterium]|nr:hypothetical protein [Actinomycetota bacterium]
MSEDVATGDQPASIDPEPAAVEASPARKRHARRHHPGWRLFMLLASFVLAAAAFWAGFTFQGTYANAHGEPTEVIVATWMRDNKMGPLVAKLEDIYYTYVSKPEVGGTPTLSADISAEDSAGLSPEDTEPSSAPSAIPSGPPSAIPSGPPSAIPSGPPSVMPSPIVTPVVEHLNPPPPITSPVPNPEPQEGLWQPVGSRVAGLPAMYVARVRADNVHTSYYASVLWIDTSLAKAMFIPGYEEPGGPNPFNGALPKELWPIVLANFNGAFRLEDSMGGYYYGGEMVKPLVDGKASTVVYKDGSIKVGKWGRDLQMSDDIQAVRQNLNLIVDKGVSKVSSETDNVIWGATTDKGSLAWRAAIGQLADGSIIYIGSPFLSADGLANTLVGAGAQEAMVLDMNTWWTAGFYFRHKKNGTPLCRKLDPSLAEGCDRFLYPYKRDSFQFLANAPMSP